MKLLLVALALLYPANGGSLGIGIDVLPEAFTFAARKVGLVADLRLTRCTASRCLWDLGDGLRISADHTNESLDVYRIEAALDQPPPAASLSAVRYEKACLAIIALVEHDANVVDLRATARAIAPPPGETPQRILIESAGRSIRLYGTSSPEASDKHLSIRRCGANAS